MMEINNGQSAGQPGERKPWQPPELIELSLRETKQTPPPSGKRLFGQPEGTPSSAGADYVLSS